MKLDHEQALVTPEVARTCGQDLLRRLVFSKDRRILQALVTNPNLTEREVGILVRQRGVPADIIKRIFEDRRWNSTYSIIVDLVKNPSSPRHLVLRYLKFLYRQDLATVARNVFLAGPVRRLAIHLLETRIEELETGEKVALARAAPAPILRVLLQDEDVHVVSACLMNGQLPEVELLSFLSDRKINPQILTAVASSKLWASRYKIRKALAQHPNLPEKYLEAVMSGLLLQDLMALVNSAQVKLPTRLAARRIIIKKIATLGVLERVQLAKKAERRLIDILLRDRNRYVIRALLKNRRISQGHVAYLALTSPNQSILTMIAESPTWAEDARVRLALEHNPAWNSPTTLSQRDV